MRDAALRIAFLVTIVARGVAFAASPEAGAVEAAAGIRADMDKGDVDAAIARGEAAVAADRGDAETWLWLGRAYGRKAQTGSVFSRVGLAKKCQAAFEKAVALDPRSVDAREDLVTYYLQAPSIMGGSKEKARGQAAELAKLDAVRGHIARGRILAGDKDFAAAETEFAQALAADPASFRGAVALGNFYVTQKRWADARALWQRRLDSNAGDTMARYQLARVASDSGTDLEKGVEHLEAYLAVPAQPGHPTWADAHWRLGLLYEKLGRADDAKAEMREALRLVPGHLQARKDLERFQK